jgi:hypothetical protein
MESRFSVVRGGWIGLGVVAEPAKNNITYQGAGYMNYNTDWNGTGFIRYY